MNEKTEALMDIKVLDNAARGAASEIAVTRGIVQTTDFSQVADHAKFMSQSREAVPKHLRGNVGMCIAIQEMAMEWGFRAYGVANLCYVVNDRMAFEAQLMIAIANKHAGLTQRLRPEYDGEGENLVCIVRGQFKDESEPCVYRSPKIGTIKPKNSPLWQVDPPRQLFLFSARAFVRMYCPQVMLGIFGSDEIQDNPHIGFDNAKDVTEADPAAPSLHERLQASQRGGQNGFHDGVVDKGLNGGHEPQQAAQPEPEANSEQPAKKPRGRPKKPKEDHTTQTDTHGENHQVDGPQHMTEAELVEGLERTVGPLAPEPVKEPEPPKTPTEYAVWVKEWLLTAMDEDTIEARWASERRLRNAANVTEELRRPIRAMVEERIAQLERQG